MSAARRRSRRPGVIRWVPAFNFLRRATTGLLRALRRQADEVRVGAFWRPSLPPPAHPVISRLEISGALIEAVGQREGISGTGIVLARELPDHTFNHSAVISVTDSDGTVRARTSETTGPDDTFVAAVQAQIAATSPRHP